MAFPGNACKKVVFRKPDFRFLRPSARHQFTLRDHGYGASASRGVPIYVPAFAGTHCA